MASGYPWPRGVVLWTRLITDFEQGDGGLGTAAIPVRWEIAADDAMRRIVASGTAAASPEWAHAVHVEVKGLEPDRWYWYRFTAGGAASPIGRTRTAPALDATPSRLRFAFASCQNYEHGTYGAYRHIVADAPDLIAFLGDYIYESSWGRDHVRAHGAGEPYTLAEYRMRYARYKSDRDLQAAHAASPWIVTWDDHEVDNDYAADRPEDGMDRERFLERRAAAYRAYYEHMPLPARMRPDGPYLRLYTQLGWGRLARFYLLDDRQYRRWQVCPRRSGGGNVVDPARCRHIADPARSMLGARQEAWLSDAFARSRAQWNVLAQQTLMAQIDRKPGDERRFWTDGWDGYPAARRRLLADLQAQRVANPVVIGGDMHYHAVADLKPDFDDPRSPVVASEFCGTSLTSQARPQRELDAARAKNPHLKFADARHRGYVRVTVSEKALRADLRAMEHVRTPDAACSTLASFVVAHNRPGAQQD
ncbi:MAG: alkaline phosphatase D family protein [Burkholderiales bacterium]|nr:alkaline phosphatase D family protein [Burkholderiales bacterium]